MLDVELQIVDSEVVDISENAEQLSAAFNLGKRGIPAGTAFVIHIEETSADTNVDPVDFVLQVSVDGVPTVWHDVAAITLEGDGGVADKGPFSVPIGPLDLRVETRGVDIYVRVAVRYADASGTDNFTYSAYLGSSNSYAHFSSAGQLHN
jgi:hypothetical protein